MQSFSNGKSSVSMLVTGGTGFLGSFIVNAILDRHPEWAITVLDLNSPATANPLVTYEVGDITDKTFVSALISQLRPSCVIHSAGVIPDFPLRYGRKHRDHVFNVNVTGTQNLLTAAQASGTKAFVWTGSCAAVTDNMRYQYPNIDERWPTSSKSLTYGESKAAAEALVLSSNDEKFATCALRPSVIFGPGDKQLIPSVHACIARGETPFVIGDGENLWDVTYVGNVADAHVLAVENLLSRSKTAAGEAIFISNGEPITFRDICLAVWKAFGHYPPYEFHIPVCVAIMVGYIAELFAWCTDTPITLSRGSVFDACSVMYFKIEKARKLLGYKPSVGIEEGIRIGCEEYAQRLEMHKVGKVM